MSITITKQPSGIYPAYNDSYLEFSSTLADNYKAEITFFSTPLLTTAFLIYPNSSGVYLFNLKEGMKVVFNQDGFTDSNVFTDAFYKNISGNYIAKSLYIKVFNTTTDETFITSYEFYKGVKQIGESIFSNTHQLLTHTDDGVNHNLTYFEGFPFHFDIQRAGIETLKIKSLSTGNETELIESAETSSFRLNVDHGNGENWTFSNFLSLITGVNKLELYADDVFKSNITINKKKECSGVYLKWFNSQGGFSFYLFDEFLTEEIKGADSGTILDSTFSNIEDVVGLEKSIGKTAASYKNVKAKFSKEDYHNLKDIFKSPSIQMYTSMDANVEGKFIDVRVNGTLVYSNKKKRNEIKLTISMPEVITVKY